MKQRLVICCDGTWNKPSKDSDGETNVQRIFKLSLEGDVGKNFSQINYYDAGVGSSDHNIKDKIFGGIAGNGIDKNIMEAYLCLCINYKPGDHIYLFGFSRGAYTVRSLAGLIRNCGILKPKYIHLIQTAYDLYRNRSDFAKPDSTMMKGFKNHYTNCEENSEIEIQFMGVFDTVGSLGIPLRQLSRHNYAKYKFHDTKLSSYVKNAYHALAIDEYRMPFVPTLWQQTEQGIQRNQTLEQRWFIGAHSNVGGGYPNCKLRDQPLMWMLKNAANSGLEYDQKSLANLGINIKQSVANSFTWYYRLLGKVVRKIEQNNSAPQFQTVDQTVIEKLEQDASYRPITLQKVFPKYYT